MEPTTKDYESARQLSFGQLFSKKADTSDYVRSLANPWSGGAKIPLGFPVKSTVTQLLYRFPVTIQGTAFTVGTYSTTLTTAGSPVAFWFAPARFDTNLIFNNSSTNTSGPQVLFQNWNATAVSKGYATQMASYRVVSAACRFRYTGAALYAKGQIFTCASNARDQQDYGVGLAAYGQFIIDPDTKACALRAGLEVEQVYAPIDMDSLSFISTSIADANMQDWSAFFSLDGYDSVNGTSGMFDIVINYECIPFGAYEQLIGPTLNPGGTQQDVKEAVEKAKKAKEVSSDQGTRNAMEDVLWDVMTGRNKNTQVPWFKY